MHVTEPMCTYRLPILLKGTSKEAHQTLPILTPAIVAQACFDDGESQQNVSSCP